MLIKASLGGDGLAQVLGRAAQDQGLGAVEGRRESDLALLGAVLWFLLIHISRFANSISTNPSESVKRRMLRTVPFSTALAAALAFLFPAVREHASAIAL